MPQTQLHEARVFREAALRAYGTLQGRRRREALGSSRQPSGPHQCPEDPEDPQDLQDPEDPEDCAPLGSSPLDKYCPILARYYRWCQSANVVYIAVRIPTGKSACHA